jgi:hypothetical protein
LHSEYTDPKAEKTAELSGPAGAAGKRKKSSDATAGVSGPAEKKKKLSNAPAATLTPEEKSEKQRIHEERDRAKSFKKNHPGMNGLPDRMDKALFKQLTEKHGKNTNPKPKSKKKKHN